LLESSFVQKDGEADRITRNKPIAISLVALYRKTEKRIVYHALVFYKRHKTVFDLFKACFSRKRGQNLQKEHGAIGFAAAAEVL
jgi:hypothetical protein